MFQEETVRLRAAEESDIPTFAMWYADPDVMTHQTSGPLVPKGQEAHEEMVRGWSKDAGNAVFSLERLSDDALIGVSHLRGGGPLARYATLVIMLGKPFWSQG